MLVTIDWGALHEGYCSDCTRTYATGEGISAQASEVYELVLEAQTAGLAAVRAGAHRAARSTRSRARSSSAAATASASGTASATAWAWRYTRGRASRARPAGAR